MLSLLAVSPLAGNRWASLMINVKKDAMQPLSTKSRKKGSRKRTCPKADMPISRQVLCALINAYVGGCDSRTRFLGPWPSWPQNRPIRFGGRYRLRAVNRLAEQANCPERHDPFPKSA